MRFFVGCVFAGGVTWRVGVAAFAAIIGANELVVDANGF